MVVLIEKMPVPVGPATVSLAWGYGALDGTPLGRGNAPEPVENGLPVLMPEWNPLGLRWEW